MNADSPNNSSTGSMSVADAAQRLQDSLKALEGALNPMAERLKTLEKSAEDSAAFDEDRARLARELDDARADTAQMKTRQGQYEARETEFKKLADETMHELDTVISQVRDTLSSDGGSA